MGDEKVEVINIKNVLEIIYKNILVILLITVIFASISFIVSKVFLHKEYRSSVSLYVMNNKVTQNTGEILSSDISASQMLVNTYAVILSDKNMEQINYLRFFLLLKKMEDMQYHRLQSQAVLVWVL